MTMIRSRRPVLGEITSVLNKMLPCSLVSILDYIKDDLYYHPTTLVYELSTEFPILTDPDSGTDLCTSTAALAIATHTNKDYIINNYPLLVIKSSITG